MVSYTNSGSRDTGTLAHDQHGTDLSSTYRTGTDQTSVVQHRSPGSSCNDENRAIFRFSHISFACSSVEANSNRLLECFFTIVSNASAAFEITSGAPWILKNRESCVGYCFCVVPALLIAFITVATLAQEETRKIDTVLTVVIQQLDTFWTGDEWKVASGKEIHKRIFAP